MDPAGFNEEYVITIYEVKKTFPTKTMIQQVYRTFECKIPRVKIELFSVKQILSEIQAVLRTQSSSGKSGIDSDFANLGDSHSGGKGPKEANTLDTILEKYVTNDDVGGGLPKMLDLFFSESLAQSFIELENHELRRAYLELFTGIEKWMSELHKVAEVFSIVGRNVEKSKLAGERLEDRTKVLMHRKKLYKLH